MSSTSLTVGGKSLACALRPCPRAWASPGLYCPSKCRPVPAGLQQSGGPFGNQTPDHPVGTAMPRHRHLVDPRSQLGHQPRGAPDLIVPPPGLHMPSRSPRSALRCADRKRRQSVPRCRAGLGHHPVAGRGGPCPRLPQASALHRRLSGPWVRRGRRYCRYPRCRCREQGRGSVCGPPRRRRRQECGWSRPGRPPMVMSMSS